MDLDQESMDALHLLDKLAEQWRELLTHHDDSETIAENIHGVIGIAHRVAWEFRELGRPIDILGLRLMCFALTVQARLDIEMMEANGHHFTPAPPMLMAIGYLFNTYLETGSFYPEDKEK